MFLKSQIELKKKTYIYIILIDRLGDTNTNLWHINYNTKYSLHGNILTRTESNYYFVFSEILLNFFWTWKIPLKSFDDLLALIIFRKRLCQRKTKNTYCDDKLPYDQDNMRFTHTFSNVIRKYFDSILWLIYHLIIKTHYLH